MLLLLDESGDKGLKIGEGSSDWFIIAAVLFPTRAIGEKCSTELTNLHDQLGPREFHFSKDPDTRREKVVDCIRSFGFTYHVVACDKTRLNIKAWKKPQHLLFAVVDRLIDYLAQDLTECILRFDDIGGTQENREYGKHIVERAGKVGREPRIVDHKAMISERDSFGQLADYVCGSVTRSIKNQKKNAHIYREMLQKREGKIIYWPEKDTG